MTKCKDFGVVAVLKYFKTFKIEHTFICKTRVPPK